LLGNLDELSLPTWLLVGFVVVVGTMVTFALIVSALRHISATRVAIVAMLEPVAASAVAWAWLGESLGAQQLAGGAIVLGAIALAQTAR
jgi:drug/metabolite transporter (DMT)-like permease